MVVCRYARHGRDRTHDAGFFVFDTRAGRVAVAADEAAARVLLQAQGIDAMPTLKRSHFFRTRRI